jgi:selenide,water dikinase
MAQVMRQLTPQKHPDLLVGTETLDDAGVFRVSDELALVQTVDFFPPLVDDPRDFGRIAAANALSDVYAMGGEPMTALNIVCFPDKALDFNVLAAILNGGAEVVARAGAVIVGGHSVRDEEIKYGLAVTGRVHPRRFLTNAGARPGDMLVLTKPIGSGVLTSAAKSGKLRQDDLREAILVMSALNRPGRDAAMAVGVNACTDVTGFGLIGHAFEMACGSKLSILLDASAVPLMEHTLAMADQGVVTRAHLGTREHLAECLVVDAGVDETRLKVLLDAQTSGGLLLSVAPDRCEALAAELQMRDALCAAIIGRTEPGDAGRIHVRT